MKPKVYLVKITAADVGWKGTWYRVGQEHFVQQNPWWPFVYNEKWHALTPNVWGGINEVDCVVLRGFWPWLRCLWFRLTARDVDWMTAPTKAPR
jgi:hypothetical protein